MKNLSALCFLLILSINSSAQSGITWNTDMNISTNTYSNMHPRMVLDAAGNPLVCWGRMSDESVFFSRWNGTMFTIPVKLNPVWLSVATASWMGPDIASHGDTVYVVVKQTPEADTASHIYIMSSFDGGQNFSVPVQVDFIGDSISRFPAVTIDASGNPIVAFMKFNATFGDARWVVTKSADYGNTFTVDVKASGWGNSAAVCDCCPGAIISDGNNTAMLYRNNNNNIRDIWMGVSTNNATTFINGCNIDNNNWMLSSCPSSGPDGIIIGDTLFSVFMNGGSGMNKTFLSKSSVSAIAVNSTATLTGNITGLTQQNYPRIAGFGNAVAIAWRQTVSGSSQLPVLFTNDINNGFPAAYDTADLADITNTDVAVGNGKIFVVWEDDNSGTVKYRSGTFVTTGVTENISGNVFTITPNPATNSINVQLQSENSTLTVTNISGKIIFTQKTFSKKSIGIGTSEWSNGIYFITVYSEKSIGTQKIVKE